MSDAIDPDELLRTLQVEAGEPPLSPLRVASAPESTRRGIAGRAIDRLRAQLLRLLSPVLGDLLMQLERDRHRQRAEVERLTERVTALERDIKKSQ